MKRILFLPLILALGCGETAELPNRDYSLVWEDNFNGEQGTSPSVDNWNFEVGTGQNGWGNNELQYYTNRPENASMDGEGNLVITAIEEAFEGSGFTSARITTKGKQEFTYGRFEARLKTPFSQGLWPAFWMLGADIDNNVWPGAGEIDVMELRGQAPSEIAGSIHGPGYSGGDAIGEDFELTDTRFDTEFHVFAVEWGPNFIDYFVDDNLYQTLTPESLPEGAEWVFDKNFFLLLNVAVGGNYVGNPNQNSRFPQTMTIDYVRVYQ
ncbi:MAG: glycoside hydrolase family 16 protein [Ekhidna sp.]|nr:glycoside hydrolase family 16 protein [Ekhidna sp.]